MLMTCDCLNDCGDDANVSAGKAAPCDYRRALLAAQAAQKEKELAQACDAARWREAIKHVGGEIQPGGARFVLNTLSPIPGANIMRGSVSEHFGNAIDAAIAANLGRY